MKFKGFHEILPGLGAFGIAPDEDGSALGLDSLEEFLDEALTHLCNQTTAQERVSFHVSEAYLTKEDPVPYGALRLSEADVFAGDHRAIPPAEHMVLVAWYRNDVQKQLAQADNGLVFVRLGLRRGALHVHPNLAQVRHIVLRTTGRLVAPGLILLREPGFRVYTRLQLRAELQKHAGASGVAAWTTGAEVDHEEYIYAVFKTCHDSRYADQRWDGAKVMSLIERFESDARNKPVTSLGRTSPDPRILSLRELLKARLLPDGDRSRSESASEGLND